MKAVVRALDLHGLLSITPARHEDARGFFTETYHADAFRAYGVVAIFVQDNLSRSVLAGTVRGLHFQSPPRAQAKLIRVARGAIFDVTVDLRRSSKTYGRGCGVTMSARDGELLYVPRGFAHGFCALEPNTEVAYKADDYYSPEHEAGILWDDPEIGVAWPVKKDSAFLSDKDRALPLLHEFESPFTA